MSTENQVETPVTEPLASPPVELPDVENLMSALKKERETRESLQKQLNEKATKEKELQIQLDRVKAIDPDQFQKLKEQQAKRDEEDLVLRREYEKAKQYLLTETETAHKQTAELKKQYDNLKTRTAIEKAFFEAGGRKSSFDLSAQGTVDISPVEGILSILQNRIKLEEDGKIVFLNDVGSAEINSEGRTKTIGEKMIELRKGSMGALFEPENNNAGTGATPTVSYNGKAVKVFSRAQARAGHANMDEIANGTAIIS